MASFSCDIVKKLMVAQHNDMNECPGEVMNKMDTGTSAPVMSSSSSRETCLPKPDASHPQSSPLNDACNENQACPAWSTPQYAFQDTKYSSGNVQSVSDSETRVVYLPGNEHITGNESQTSPTQGNVTSIQDIKPDLNLMNSQLAPLESTFPTESETEQAINSIQCESSLSSTDMLPLVSDVKPLMIESQPRQSTESEWHSCTVDVEDVFVQVKETNFSNFIPGQVRTHLGEGSVNADQSANLDSNTTMSESQSQGLVYHQLQPVVYQNERMLGLQQGMQSCGLQGASDGSFLRSVTIDRKPEPSFPPSIQVDAKMDPEEHQQHSFMIDTKMEQNMPPRIQIDSEAASSSLPSHSQQIDANFEPCLGRSIQVDTKDEHQMPGSFETKAQPDVSNNIQIDTKEDVCFSETLVHEENLQNLGAKDDNVISEGSRTSLRLDTGRDRNTSGDVQGIGNDQNVGQRSSGVSQPVEITCSTASHQGAPHVSNGLGSLGLGPDCQTSQQETRNSQSNGNHVGEMVQEFENIASENQPTTTETIMLGPASVLDPNSLEARVSMHNKSLKLKKVQKNAGIDMNLTCEWENCEEGFNDLSKFISHVTAHIGANLEVYAKNPDLMSCLWRHCGYESQRGIRDILRHVYFHAFHVKLKCLGIQMIIDNNLQACRTDGSSRNLIPELPESLICGWEHCKHVCENAEYFYRHVDCHALNAPMKNVKCSWEGCTTRVRNRTRLKDHLRSHTQEKLIACPTCGGLFSNRCKFSDHLRRQGMVENLCFQCSHCNKKYTTERLLRDHMRVHVNHYKCPCCDMTCPNPSTLNAHIRYRHSDEKPFACDYCDHRAKSAPDLRKHLEVHNEKAMFHCEYPGCDYTHKTFHGVAYHYRLLHQGPKKYQCHLCQNTFERGSLLTQHLKKKHKFKWPSGHSRFKYRQHEDGTMRLQTVRYESVELATHFMDKDTENVQSSSKEGHSAGLNMVPAYESEAPETNHVATASNDSSNSTNDKSADISGESLTLADLSYNLEMLGDVALHEPEYSRSVENSPVKSANHGNTSGTSCQKSPGEVEGFPDLPSPIHGSAFQANVAVHQESSAKFIALSSNTPTSPEKTYEVQPTVGEKSGTANLQNGASAPVNGQNTPRRTKSTQWKVSLGSPRKRQRSRGRSVSSGKKRIKK